MEKDFVFLFLFFLTCPEMFQSLKGNTAVVIHLYFNTAKKKQKKNTNLLIKCRFLILLI